MKSSINQAVLVTGSFELEGAGRGGKGTLGPGDVYLAGGGFGPPGEANFSTREGTHHWAGSLTAWSHNRERRTCRAPWREGRDTWQMGQHAPCCPSPGPATPGIIAYPLGYACPGTPQKPQLPGKLSRAFKQQPPPRGPCSGKNKAPTLQAHPASQVTPEQ